MSDCLFCKIIAGEIPSAKVYEDELCYAFKDISPLAPMHFLVIPKQHFASAAEVTPENEAVVGHIYSVIAKLAKERELTDEEKVERAALRQEYVNSVLGDLRNQLNNTYVMDEKGNKTKLTRWSEDRKLGK